MQAHAIQLGRKARVSWRACVVLYTFLVLFIALQHWVLNPPEVDSPWLILAFRLTPLLIFIPAIIKAYARGFAWLGFVLLIYFTSGVVDGWVATGWIGWLQAALSLCLFCCTLFFVRWFYKKM